MDGKGREITIEVINELSGKGLQVMKVTYKVTNIFYIFHARI